MEPIMNGEHGANHEWNAEKKSSIMNGEDPLPRDLAIEEKNKSKKWYKQYNKRQWTVFITICCINWGVGISFSLLAPFYPKLAREKKAPSSVYGFVFASYQAIIFLFSPIFGKYIRFFGRKRMLICGPLIMGTCNILIGLLDRCPQGLPFIVCSFLIKITDGFGQTAYLIASFATIGQEFSQGVSTAFSVLETVYGFGQIIGPTVGSALFELGGIVVPFTSVGVILLLSAIFAFILLPTGDSTASLPGGFLRLLQFPGVLVSYYTVAAVAFTYGFNVILLEPHCNQFGLTHIQLGFVFLIDGGTYLASATIWGYLNGDKANVHPKILSAIAGVFIASGYLFLGPAPFFPVEPLLWMTIVALLLHGIGAAGEFISTLFDCRQEAIVGGGYPDTIETSGLVSGLWNSGFAFGSLLGPGISGVLNDVVGFRNTTLVVVAIQIILVILNIVFYVCRKRFIAKKPTIEENNLHNFSVTEDKDPRNVTV